MSRRRLEGKQIEVVDPAMVAVLRAMTGAQRLRAASDMFAAAGKMIAARLREKHPNWSAEQLQAEVARRMLRGSA